MRVIRSLALVVGATILAGCTRDAEPSADDMIQTAPVAVPAGSATPAIAFVCESGQAVEVRYPDQDTASVAYLGRSYALRLVPAASGARYVGEGVEWRTASRPGQETATLSRVEANDDVGGVLLERCTRPSLNPSLPVQNPADQTAALPAEPAPGGVLAASTACRPAQLRLASDSGDAGAGNRANVFSVTNTGPAPCSVAGYPSVSLLDGRGAALGSIRSDQNPNTATPVNLTVGGKAFFDIAWNVVPHEGAGERVCPTAASVRVRIAGDATALTIPLVLTPCGGRIRVNPFRSQSDPGAAPVPTAAT